MLKKTFFILGSLILLNFSPVFAENETPEQTCKMIALLTTELHYRLCAGETPQSIGSAVNGIAKRSETDPQLVIIMMQEMNDAKNAKPVEFQNSCSVSSKRNANDVAQEIYDTCLSGLTKRR